jgi:hypothetical protein
MSAIYLKLDINLKVILKPADILKISSIRASYVKGVQNGVI